MSDGKELQDKLDEAVKEVLGMISPGVVTAWVLVAHQANYDENGDGVSSYPIVLMNGSQADHVIRGLLEVAQDHVRGVGKWASHFHGPDDEDEDDE
jgi:hypothetical protein